MTLLPFDVELSRAIERNTSHSRLKVLAATGVVRLRNAPDVCPEGEWLALDYLDWKSGGDTHFAPLASVDGEMNCVGFSSRRRADKDGLWTANEEGAGPQALRRRRGCQLRSCSGDSPRTAGQASGQSHAAP